jgi:hypothetical protein
MKQYKKYIPYALIVIAIFAVMLIFQPCNKGNTHTLEKKEVVQEQQLVKDREAIANRKVELLQGEVRKRDSVIISLKAKKDITEGQLKDSRQTAFRLSQQLKTAKELKDTASYFENCDSLVDVVMTLTGVLMTYEEYVDTLVKTYDAQLRAKDQVIANRVELYGQLRTSFDKVTDNYNSLYKDYAVEVKKRKKAKAINRIAGIVIVGLGTLYLTK